jgi:hypothetical protein
MTYSVVYLDGSPRGRYCGEFSPDAEAMKMEQVNQFWNVCYQAAKAIGLPWSGGAAIYGSNKSMLVEFKIV